MKKRRDVALSHGQGVGVDENALYPPIDARNASAAHVTLSASHGVVAACVSSSSKSAAEFERPGSDRFSAKSFA
jgi:hypothetical protein